MGAYEDFMAQRDIDLANLQALTAQPTAVDTKAASIDTARMQKMHGLGVNGGTQNLGAMFGSATQQLGTGLADLLMGVSGTVASTILPEELGGKVDTILSTALDPYKKAEYTDKVWGYDRSGYEGRVKNVEDAVSEGRWGDAFTSGIVAAPETIVNSLPDIIALFASGGSLTAVRAAEKAAKGYAAVQGLNKAQTAVKAAEAVSTAKKALKPYEKLAQISSENAGLMAIASKYTVDQNDQRIAEGLPEMTPAERVRAFGVNVLTSGLDRWAFKDIVQLKKSKALEPVWGKLDLPGKTEVVKKLASIATAAPKEFAQEYVQTMGEIFNVNYGTEEGKTLADVFLKETHVNEALTAGFLGAGAGTAMSTPQGLLGAYGASKQESRAKETMDSLLKGHDQGFADVKQRDEALDIAKTTEGKAKQAFEGFGELKTKADQIVSSEGSSLRKLKELQDTLEGVTDDTGGAQAINNFGNQEIQDFTAELESLELPVTELLENLPKNASALDKYLELGAIIQTQDLGVRQEAAQGFLDKTNKLLKKKASELEKNGYLKLDFTQRKRELNKAGIIASKEAESIVAKGDPISIKPDLEKVKESSPAYRTLSLGKAKEVIKNAYNETPNALKATLSQYDNKALGSLVGEINTQLKSARKVEDKRQTTGPILSRTKALVSGYSEVNKLENTLSAIEKIKQQRKAKSESNKSTTFETRFDKMYEEAVAEPTGVNPTEATPKSAGNNIKDTVRTVQEAIKHFANLTPEQQTKLETTIQSLKDKGLVAQTWASKKLTDLKAKQPTKEEIVKVAEGLKKGAKEATKDSVIKAVQDTLKSVQKKATSHLTDTEKKAIKSAIDLAVTTKTVTVDRADKLLTKYGLDKYKPTTKDITELIKNLPATVQKTFKERESTYRDTEATIKKAVSDVNKKRFVKEVKKDLKTLKTGIIDIVTSASTSTKAKLKTLKAKAEAIDTLDMYNQAKELAKDAIAGFKIKKVESIQEIPELSDVSKDFNKDC